jgi:hypothetical protein
MAGNVRGGKMGKILRVVNMIAFSTSASVVKNLLL